MGNCGCDSSTLDVAMFRAGDKYIVISVFPGCTECWERTGIGITLYNEKSYEKWVDAREIIDLSDELKEDCDDFSIPVLDWAEIGKAIDKEKFADIDEYNCFADFWHDQSEWVRDAARKTVISFFEKRKQKK